MRRWIHARLFLVIIGGAVAAPTAEAGAPWITLGRAIGIGHSAGYHAPPGCRGSAASYADPYLRWPSTYPVPISRGGMGMWSVPTAIHYRDAAPPSESLPTILVPPVGDLPAP